MFQNLCLSLLALVTYLRNEIMEDHGIYNSTIGLFWNLQDFELGRVRMVKLLLLVVHKCFMSKLSFPVYMLMARVSQVQAALPEPSSSTFQSALLRVEFGYLASFNYICILLFCILNMCLLIHQNPCVAWFDCCSLVCLSALTLELRQLSERAETLGASFRVGTFINIYQGITFVNICLTLFDQTSNVS